jgi:hypothetical protein
VYSYVWWVANSALASTFYVRTAGQYHPISAGGGPDGFYATASSVYINETTVQHQFYRTTGLTIDSTQVLSGTWEADFEYLVYWYNSAGAEDINILGVEFVYEGYI